MGKIKDVYGLNVQPFSRGLSPNTFCFSSIDLNQAACVVVNSVNEHGIGIICGDSGTGVSYSTYVGVSRLDSMHTVCYYPVCRICPRDFYKECCRLTGAVPEGKGRQSMISAIREKAGSIKNQGRLLVLVLDNAQNIPELVVNDLKTMISDAYGLSNRMALILCGTKELKAVLNRSGNTSLKNEVSFLYTMKGLSETETVEYVRHKLKVAGASTEVVEEQALRLLYSLCSRGNCKEVDNMMRIALMLGAQYDRKIIDIEIIRAAAAHLNTL